MNSGVICKSAFGVASSGKLAPACPGPRYSQPPPVQHQTPFLSARTSGSWGKEGKDWGCGHQGPRGAPLARGGGVGQECKELAPASDT